MTERLDATMPQIVRRHVGLFTLLAFMALVTGVLLVHGATNLEGRAFRAVCGDLVGQVLEGEATRFDYMATRCPAWMLTDAEAEAGLETAGEAR